MGLLTSPSLSVSTKFRTISSASKEIEHEVLVGTLWDIYISMSTVMIQLSSPNWQTASLDVMLNLFKCMWYITDDSTHHLVIFGWRQIYLGLRERKYDVLHGTLSRNFCLYSIHADVHKFTKWAHSFFKCYVKHVQMHAKHHRRISSPPHKK